MTRRYEALDGLRGVAALSVVLIHIPWPNHISGTGFGKHVYLFVDLFFILSGFILTAAYRDGISNRDQLRRFLILRLFRVYPVHLAVLLVLFVIEIAKILARSSGLAHTNNPLFSGQTSVESFFGHLLLLQGSGFVRPSWNGPSWSIGCEAFAYIFFGVAVLSGVMTRRFGIPIIVAMSLVAYGVVLVSTGSLNAKFDYGLLRCLAGFALGVSVATCALRKDVLSSFATCGDNVVSLVTAVLAMLSVLLISVAKGFGDLAVVPCFALLVFLLQSDRGIVARLLQTRAVAFLGLISYSIYMVNYPIFMAMSSVGKRLANLTVWQGDLLFGLTLAVVISCAWASFRWIEAPGRQFGRRLAADEMKRAALIESKT
jgi:peptidoglycan/LPS O-acetylase OafA/YrhL